MRNIYNGYRKFRREVYPQYSELFQRLAAGQSPAVLFITCIDSRLNPNMITQTLPGDMMVLRSAGNVLPPYGVISSEIATIEFALVEVGIRDVIVCGHSGCRAMDYLMDEMQTGALEGLSVWLRHAHKAIEMARRTNPKATGSDYKKAVVQSNVLLQLERLGSYPFAAKFIAEEKIRLHGWYYEIGSGEISAWDPALRAFEPLDSVLFT